MVGRLIALMALLLMLVACGSDEPEQPQAPVRRTILVYMVATNSLGNNQRDPQDLAEMGQAVSAGDLNGCRLLCTTN